MGKVRRRRTKRPINSANDSGMSRYGQRWPRVLFLRVSFPSLFFIGTRFLMGVQWNEGINSLPSIRSEDRHKAHRPTTAITGNYPNDWRWKQKNKRPTTVLTSRVTGILCAVSRAGMKRKERNSMKCKCWQNAPFSLLIDLNSLVSINKAPTEEPRLGFLLSLSRDPFQFAVGFVFPASSSASCLLYRIQLPLVALVASSPRLVASLPPGWRMAEEEDVVAVEC